MLRSKIMWCTFSKMKICSCVLDRCRPIYITTTRRRRNDIYVLYYTLRANVWCLNQFASAVLCNFVSMLKSKLCRIVPVLNDGRGRVVRER